MEGTENVGTNRQMAWNHTATIAADLRCQDSTALAAEALGHRTNPAPLPLHERTSSEKNRPSGIRVVPYTPPRINAASVPADTRKERQPRAGSPGSAADRRRRNWQRRRLSKERFDNGSDNSTAKGAGRDGYGDDPGDALAIATTSRRSWTSRGSRSSSWRVYSGGDGDGNTAPSGGQAMMADGREDDTALPWPEEDSWQGHENEGYAGSGLGSALSTPTGGASPLASGALQALPRVSGPRSATAAAAASSRVPSGAGRANLADASSVKATTGLAPFAHSLRPLLGLPRQGHDSFRTDAAVPPPGNTSSHRRGAASPADPTPPLLSLPQDLQDLQTTGTSSALASPSSPSPSAASASSLPRPNSRRHNVIAVHADKTFSLVARDADGFPPSHTSVSSTPSPTGSFFDHDYRRPLRPPSSAAASRSLQSPPLSFATSTIRSSGSSHERLFSFSGAFGSDHRASSPLTSITSANPSRYSNHPDFSLSPGASTVCLNDEPASRELPPASTTHHLQNNHPIGNVHTAATTPDWKSKGKAKAPASATGAPKGVTGVDSTDRPPIKKASFASDHSDGSLATSTSLSFSASAVSVTTNYKVYSRSSPRLGPATAVRSTSTASVAHESSDDTVSLPSSSGSTNVVILGVSSPAAPPLPVLRRSADPDQTFASLASYPSIASFESGISSFFSDSGSTPNVVLLGASSPPAPLRYRDPTHANAESSAISGGDEGIPSSPPLRPLHPDTTTSSFYTSDSEPNYVLHNSASAIFGPPKSPSSSAASARVVVSRQPRTVYSQESLVVPPLQPLRHHWSSEKLKLYNARSRESLRHAASLQSLRRAASIKSLTSVFGQEAASTFFAGQAFLSLSIPPVPVVTAKPKDLLRQQRTLKLKRKPLPLPAPAINEGKDFLSDRTPKQALRHLRSWDSISSPPSTSSFSASPPSSPALPQQPQQAIRMMADGHPHHWSSQLSTVASESDGASMGSRVVSLPLSVLSGAPSSAGYVRDDTNAMGGSGDGGGTWRSSTGAADSIRSHNRTSASSSLRLQMDDTRPRHSRGDSLLLERPQQLYFRYANSASPSAAGGSTGPPAPALRMVRDHDEHGDGLADLDGGLTHQPSRTGLSGFFANGNNSLRNLHSSASSRSLGGVAFPVWARVYYGSGEHRALSRSTSMSDLGPGDDDVERASLVGNDGHARRYPPDAQLVGMAPVFANAEGGPGTSSLQRPLGVRKMTSSIWSPHLRRDRHAAHFHVWEPPSVTWGTGTRSVMDRRNMQVICFTVGFICPFFWMLAAFLPLPLHRQGGAEKYTDEADGAYGVSAVLTQRMVEANEMRFQSARWWRMLNRVMSVFGLLILGAVAALVVVGVRDHWGR